MARSQALGAYGEDLAARFLNQRGLVVIDRNWRCDIGEIDIVARHGSTVVFCEVKTRSSTTTGHPLEAISPRKIRKLRRLALRWLMAGSIHAPIVRFDVVGVVQPRCGPPIISYLPGIDIAWD